MKKLLPLLIILALLLCGCVRSPEPTTTAPATTVPTTAGTVGTTTPTTEAPTDPTTQPTSAPVTQPTAPPTTAPVPEPTAAPTTAPTAPPATVPVTEPPEESSLTVHFIDVGQGDCALLECDGEFALIDAGYPETGQDVVNYLQQQGVQELALVVGTHPHGDHIGGLPAVLRAFPVDTVWSGEIPFYNGYVYDFMNAVSARHVPLETPEVGETFRLGSALITVLGPVRTDYEDLNDLSLVLMVEYGDTRFLFTGDMELAAETDLLDSGADVKADVLKVGHHGSYSSTGYRLLREVAPTYAVISCGAANEYGHPHDEPLSRLKDAEVTIFRTDKMYTVVAVSDGQDITFTWGNVYAQPWAPAA